jgi:hypothetical protein
MTIPCFDAIDSAEFRELCSDECLPMALRQQLRRAIARVSTTPRGEHYGFVGGVDIVSARHVLCESQHG